MWVDEVHCLSPLQLVSALLQRFLSQAHYQKPTHELTTIVTVLKSILSAKCSYLLFLMHSLF